MKPTELRLNNYVYGINRRSEVHLPENLPLKVLQIEIFNCYCLPLDKSPAEEKEWFKISNIDLSPIPLTEQWLKDFGFKLVIWNKTIKDYQIPVINGYKLSLQFNLYKGETGLSQVRLYPEKSNTIIVLWDWYFNKEIKFCIHTLQDLYFVLTGRELIFNQ